MSSYRTLPTMEAAYDWLHAQGWYRDTRQRWFKPESVAGMANAVRYADVHPSGSGYTVRTDTFARRARP